jgi:molybdate transport system ATP-binding protein
VLERIKLSSGQLRKILLLKALLQAPHFLLLDNAHLGLDQESRKTLNHYIDYLARQRQQQFIISGQLSTLPGCVTHILQLDQGRISSRQPVLKKTLNRTSEKIPLVPNRIKEHYTNQVMEDFTTAVKFDQIAIRYQNKYILKEIDWNVKKGDKWSVQGRNGVGKSTLLSLIYGDHPQAYSNKIILFDQPRGSGESIWEIKKRIGFTSPELHSYFGYDFKVINVILSGLSDTFYVSKTTEYQVKIAESLLTYFDLIDKKDAPFNTLSTGLQRLTLFMRALIKAPPVLILDEPYQGLDTHTIKLCNNLLCQLLTDQHTLIFISHFPAEIPDIVKKRLVLN